MIGRVAQDSAGKREGQRECAVADPVLVARCRLGEQRAWDALVRQHGPRLEALARREFRLSPEAAEDVCQEVLMHAVGRLDALRDPLALSAWLMRATRRRCIDHLRRERDTEPLPEAVGDPRAAAAAEQALLAAAVEGAVAELPEASREIVQRFFLQDESYATISRELAIPAGTVASRIARALARLRRDLEPLAA